MRPTQTANDTVERAVPRNGETGNKQYDTVGTILKSNLTIVETETSLKHIHCIHSLFGIGTSIKSGGVKPTSMGPNLHS